MALRAVLFDMDGTIWYNPVDWGEVRRKIGLARGPLPIVHYLSQLPAEERATKERILLAAEAEGVAKGRLLPRARELVEWLKGNGILTALVTNNSRRSLEAVLTKHPLPFDRVFSREDIPMKPDPGAFLVPLRALGVPPSEAVGVGDSHLDLIAASRAGVREIILVSPREWVRKYFPPGAEFREVADLEGARRVLEGLLG
jgi:HAD superfamily hydrolase (TIGR01509 family)